MAEIHLNDIGTVFRVVLIDDETGLPLDVSQATEKKVIFRMPNRITILDKPAVFTTDGTDGCIEYVSVAGDLIMVGPWSIQGFVIANGFENYSQVNSFICQDNLVAS